MDGFKRVQAAAEGLPLVEVSTWYGTPSLKVKCKGFCRLWSKREHARDDVHDTEVLVVMCDVDEKAILIEQGGGVLFETPHYYGHGAVLIRLDDVSEKDLVDHLEHSYRLKAPSTLLKQLDEQSGA